MRSFVDVDVHNDNWPGERVTHTRPRVPDKKMTLSPFPLAVFLSVEIISTFLPG